MRGEILVERAPRATIDRDALRIRLARVWEIASIVLIVVACVFWAMFLRPQSLGGRAGYVLVSGQSMEPIYHTGDMVLVERHSRYRVGDIIAYRVPKGDPMAGAQVIHRIIGGNGVRGFVVQGDNRTGADTWRPKNADVVGAAALRLPQAVIVLQFLRSPVLLGLLAASFAFVYLLVGRKAEDPPEADEPLA
jgi:signal peptidase I